MNRLGKYLRRLKQKEREIDGKKKIEGKNKKRTLYEVIKEKIDKSKQVTPATQDEINQLRLELQKAELQRDIAIAKRQTPKKESKLKMFLDGNMHDRTRNNDERNSTKDRDKKYLHDDYAEKLNGLLGNGDKYSRENIRKVFGI